MGVRVLLEDGLVKVRGRVWALHGWEGPSRAGRPRQAGSGTRHLVGALQDGLALEELGSPGNPLCSLGESRPRCRRRVGDLRVVANMC